MDLRQLETFRTVATTRNFTRAAGLLGYAQSSVTAQIQALERDLGVPLFDRLGRQIVLTQAGQQLLAYATRLLQLAAEARLAVTASSVPVGVLTISTPETLCTYRLPALLRAAQEQLPQLQVTFQPLPVSSLRRAVRDGSIDLALLLDVPDRSPGISAETLVYEPIRIVVPPGHPLLGRPVGPLDLQAEQVLLTEADCAYRLLFEHVMRTAGVLLNDQREFNSVEAIKQCVIAGMGFAVLPNMAVTREVQRGALALLDWQGPPLDLTIQMLFNADRWHSPALLAMAQLARDVFRAQA